jgi:hypothetical protein
MAGLGPLNDEMLQLRDEHREWLCSFDSQYSEHWERLLKADDESAMTEAAVRRMLRRHGIKVEPNEDLKGDSKRPDFQCIGDETDRFYVEVTHISIEKATERSGISQEGSRVFALTAKAAKVARIDHKKAEDKMRRSINDAIFEACRGKAKQCGNQDAPVLLAIGTWHGFAALLRFGEYYAGMLLTGEESFAWDFDILSGNQVGDTYLTTELKSAAFLRPDESQEVGFARSSISGLLLVANDLEGRNPIGVLHPNPARTFNPAWLPEIKFGSVRIDWQSKQLSLDWAGGTEPNSLS